MLASFDNGPPTPCPDPFNLAEYALAAGRARPDKPALVFVGGCGHETLTHKDLRTRVLGLAGAFASYNLRSGTRILLRLGNTPDFPIAFLAAAAADLVPVVVSSLLTEPEVQSVVTMVSPGLALVDPTLPLGPMPCPVRTVEDLSGEPAPPLVPRLGDPDRPGYIVFTSGTSGKPRAVVHAHRALWARRMMWADWYGLRADDRVMHAGAFNWTYTLGTGLLDPWAAGATALIPAPDTPIETLAQHIKDQGVTVFAAAPAHYRRILDRTPSMYTPQLRHGLSAGDTLSESLADRWTQLTGTRIHQAFGMSECSTFISGSPERPAPDNTMGWAQTGRHIAILQDDHAISLRGTPGRLAVHRTDPGLMLGYLNADNHMDLPLSGDWFVTNDTGSMEPDGAVRYLGRADDVMNAGGVRVSPHEIETVLATHSAITDCAVTEVAVKPDVTVIAAFCISDSPLDEAALSAHMSTKLARFKCPRLFVRVDVLPRNTNGKLKRRGLRDAWETQHGQA